MLKKQLRIVLSILVLVAALVVVYFVVLQPVLNTINPTTEAPTVTTESGELVGVGDRILMTDQLEKKDIARVDVHPGSGKSDYAVVRYETASVVEGSELCPTNAEVMASFFVNVGYLLSMTKVTAAPEELGEYGLDPAQKDVANFTVTKNDQSNYKVWIGDKIPTGAGYYARLDGRDAVYVLDSTLETSVLVNKTDLLDPYVAAPISQTEYFMIDNFKLYNFTDKFNMFLNVQNFPVPEGSEALVNYQMMFPARYELSLDAYDQVLRLFANFKGTRVAATEITEDTLREYGFASEGAHRISFDFKDKKYDFLISAPNEEGNYYVTAVEFNTIVEVPAATMPFLNWDLLKYVERPIFGRNINDIEYMAVEADGRKDEFYLEGTGKDLKVTYNGAQQDVPRFRQWYKAILYVDIQDYETLPENPTLLATLSVRTRTGEDLIYKFYFINTRRCFVTINDSGEFYVLRDAVNKLISDTAKYLRGEDVIAEAAN